MPNRWLLFVALLALCCCQPVNSMRETEWREAVVGEKARPPAPPLKAKQPPVGAVEEFDMGGRLGEAQGIMRAMRDR